jgi:hypothetical protein
LFFEQIESRKLRLHQIVATIDSGDIRKRKVAEEALGVLSAWNWKLSGWGFFSLDRTVVSGV